MNNKDYEIYREFRDNPNVDSLEKIFKLKVDLTTKLITGLAHIHGKEIWVNVYRDISHKRYQKIIETIKDINVLIKRPSCKEIIKQYRK